MEKCFNCSGRINQSVTLTKLGDVYYADCVECAFEQSYYSKMRSNNRGNFLEFITNSSFNSISYRIK